MDMDREQRGTRPAVIYLLRHAQTAHNASGRLQGHLDVPINERGREQARTVGTLLQGKGIAAVYASDLSRARETAQIAAAPLGLTVTCREDLREVNMGCWAGLSREEVAEQDPDGVAAMQADPEHARPKGGESYREMGDRVWRALNEIAAAHSGESVLVTSHGGPLWAIMCRALGLSWSQRDRFTFQNCGLLALIWHSDKQVFVVPGP